MEVGLAAYTDRLSGRPGDVIRFFVSSTHDGTNLESRKITAKLTRCICSDPNPKGPEPIEPQEEDKGAKIPSTIIFTILAIGLGFDLMNTWITNISILRMYIERKGGRE